MSRRAPIPHRRSSKVRDHTRSRALAPPPETIRSLSPSLQKTSGVSGGNKTSATLKELADATVSLKHRTWASADGKLLQIPSARGHTHLSGVAGCSIDQKQRSSKRKQTVPPTCNPKHTQGCNEIMGSYEHPDAKCWCNGFTLTFVSRIRWRRCSFSWQLAAMMCQTGKKRSPEL